MGYSETMCELCGVSFAIARLRRADEPQTASWNYSGEAFIDDDKEARDDGNISCYKDSSSGCSSVPRGEEFEHVAGPGCSLTTGYCGYRISLKEMKVRNMKGFSRAWGCRPSSHITQHRAVVLYKRSSKRTPTGSQKTTTRSLNSRATTS